MKKVFELKMEVKRAEEGTGINISFAGGIMGRVSEVMNKKDVEKLNKCVEEMSNVIRSIVLRDLLEGTGIDFQDVMKSGELKVITDEKEIEKELNKKRESNADILKKIREEKEEIYNSLSQKEKEEIDEFERELDKCKTIDEQIALTLSKIGKILSK